MGANTHLRVPDEAAYSAWKISPRRFAITFAGEVSPVIGYAMQGQDSSAWFIERKGRVFRRRYGSLAEAAETLLTMEAGPADL
ncbi:MAG TPA: hypothetical protein VMH80_17245 [Bryobacteraceae bacterium]|nr:hypothetical protein [Bryobacteraceae bacterium]